MKIYREVNIDVEKRLPKEEVIAINKQGEKLVGFLGKNIIDNSIRCESEEGLMDAVTHYLEEVELPSHEDIKNEMYARSGCEKNNHKYDCSCHEFYKGVQWLLSKIKGK